MFPALPKARDLLIYHKNGVQGMAQDQLITAIGRIERAISKLEQVRLPTANDSNDDLKLRYDALKSATEQAVAEIDRLILKEGSANG